MSQTYAFDRVHTAFALPALGRGVARIARPLRAQRIAGPRAASRGATFVKLAFAHLIGLAFVLVLPFAGIAALSWFAARALLDSAA